MTKDLAREIWSFLSRECIGHAGGHGSDRFALFLDDDLPLDLSERLLEFAQSMDRADAIRVAELVARKFYLAGTMPEEHLLLVAHLFEVGALPLRDAVDLAQVNYLGGMAEDARSLVLLAETIAEEDRLGFVALNVGDLFPNELRAYYASRMGAPSRA